MQKPIRNLLAPKTLLFLAIIYSIALLYASLMPTEGLPKVSFRQADKIFHFLAYFGLASLWYLHYMRNNLKNGGKQKHFLIIGMLIIAFGILIEVLQDKLTSYRTIDGLDVLANSLGVLLAYIVARMLRLKFQNFKFDK